MSIRVKYNHTMKFRRRAAFLRMYRAKNPRLQFTLEMAGAALCAIVALVIRFGFSKSQAHALVYVFFFAALIGVYLVARLLRAAVMVLRVRKPQPGAPEKEYVFTARGFAFGPVDDAGRMIETTWREIDRVYFMQGAVYILCMGRRHWAAVDPSLMIDGTAAALEALIRSNLPKRTIA